MRGQPAEAVFDDLCEPQKVLLQSSGRIAAVAPYVVELRQEV
jgi:hypothetical protein